MSKKGYTVSQIAKAIGATLVGDGSLRVTGAAEPQSAGPTELAVATNGAYAKLLFCGKARAALMWQEADWQAFGLSAAILAPRPRYAMAGLSRMLDSGQGFSKGIHASAIIDPSARIGADVSIGPLTVVSAGATIGDGSVIGPQCFIGSRARVGDNASLREQVTIGARVTIGANFSAQPGVRLGGDGFSFATREKSAAETARETLGDTLDAEPDEWARIHSLAAVTIGDDCDFGSCVTVDNGTFRDTFVGNGCKFDNFVHIGHNAVIGDDCLICGHSGVSGSTRVGNNVVLGGMTGIGDNLIIGDRVITGGGTKILSSVPAGRVMLGYPATKMDKQIEIYKALRRLPRIMTDVAALQKAVFKSRSND